MCCDVLRPSWNTSTRQIDNLLALAARLYAYSAPAHADPHWLPSVRRSYWNFAASADHPDAVSKTTRTLQYKRCQCVWCEDFFSREKPLCQALVVGILQELLNHMLVLVEAVLPPYVFLHKAFRLQNVVF